MCVTLFTAEHNGIHLIFPNRCVNTLEVAGVNSENCCIKKNKMALPLSSKAQLGKI